MVFHRLLSIAVAITAISLGGCNGDSGGSERAKLAAAEQASRQLSPAAPALAAIYNRSCRNCHTIAAIGAPLTGDHLSWAARMAKGRDKLVDNVVNGFGSMPAYGMCADCDLEQIEALIDFMASPPDADEG